MSPLDEPKGRYMYFQVTLNEPGRSPTTATLNSFVTTCAASKRNEGANGRKEQRESDALSPSLWRQQQ